MINKALFSSTKTSKNAKDDWRTPKEIFDFCNKYIKFTTDLAADSENTLCEKYFSEQDSALDNTWYGVCWLNPPYSQISKFVDKSIQEFKKASEENRRLSVVWLIPARTDTKYFHKLIEFAQYIIPIKGRLKFIHPNQQKLQSAPFPSLIILTDNLKRDTIFPFIVPWNISR